MYAIKFMFEWGADDSCIWSNGIGNEETLGAGLLRLDLFPISNELKQKIVSLCKEFQTALNWAEPQSDLLWSKTEIEDFKKRAQTVYNEFVAAVGNDFEVENWIEKSI